MKYTGMPWDIQTLITPLFREQIQEEKNTKLIPMPPSRPSV